MSEDRGNHSGEVGEADTTDLGPGIISDGEREWNPPVEAIAQGVKAGEGNDHFETHHQVRIGDARECSLPDKSVELVVTSPPYPMIGMWDDIFTELDPTIADCLEENEGMEAFDRMHAILDTVWDELYRVLAPGGILAINVGDATRTLGSFRTYPNHARITEAVTDIGFGSLPEILWHKPTNSAAKFMGSGMLPPNAYPTLEHEYILLFRKGARRSFEPGSPRRYGSAYFWEERNEWFSDLWQDITGVDQTLAESVRDRSGAFPLAIPYRLVQMFSVYGDTVLDPFLGTGTTSLAALISGRHSVGYEIDPELAGQFPERASSAPELAQTWVSNRLEDHSEFTDENSLKYEAEYLDLPVRTQQEQKMRFFVPTEIGEQPTKLVGHSEPYAGDDMSTARPAGE